MPLGSSAVTALRTSFATYFRAEPSLEVSAKKFKERKLTPYSTGKEDCLQTVLKRNSIPILSSTFNSDFKGVQNKKVNNFTSVWKITDGSLVFPLISHQRSLP